LRLGEHVDCPATEDAVGAGGEDVVGILRADEGDRVDGVGVAEVVGAGERRFLDGGAPIAEVGARVPEQDLTAVGATDYEVRVEGGESSGQDVRGAVEDVFGAVVEVEIPDLEEAVGVVWCRRVFGVRCED
jgi:hypothetical protein